MIRRLAALMCLALSQSLAASEPSAVYLQVPLSRAELDAWLASPVPQAADFHDWARMNPQWQENWRRYFTTLPAATVGEFLASWEAPPEDSAGMTWCHDADLGELHLGAVFYDENFISFASLLAALRGVARHQQQRAAGHVYIYPFLWGGDPDALLRTRPGRSELLAPDSAPPALKAAAEAFLQARMHGWQPADAQRRCRPLPGSPGPAAAQP